MAENKDSESIERIQEGFVPQKPPKKPETDDRGFVPPETPKPPPEEPVTEEPEK